MYIAFSSTNSVFGGLPTFNNTPTANTGIYVSYYSTGTGFNSNIAVNSTNGQGVQFCGGNTTATATLSAGNTITVGAGARFSKPVRCCNFANSSGRVRQHKILP